MNLWEIQICHISFPQQHCLQVLINLLFVCVWSGCCSEVPANSPPRCWESVWCQTPQVLLALKYLFIKHTDPQWVLTPDLCSHSDALTGVTHCWNCLVTSVLLSAAMQLLHYEKKISSIWHTRAHTLARTVCTSLTLPCGKLTILVKPSNQILSNSFTQVYLSGLLTGRVTWKDSLNLPVTHNQTHNIRFSSENHLITK